MRHFIIAGFVLAALSACNKDKKKEVTNPPATNEEELITTFTIDFTDVNGVAPTVSATFRDVDGPGGAAPELFDTIRLQPSTVYNATITLLNESVIPAENISDEVLEEGDAHLFCFGPDGSLNLGVLRTDSDGTYEIGLSSKWTTGAASEGNMLIRLKHQPGVKDGTCEPGETDLELSFHTIIE
jgi:hypothetical protein